MTPRFAGGVAAFTAFGLDQLSKLWMLEWLVERGSVVVLPFFNFSLGYNTGVSFSLFAGNGEGTRWALTGIAILAAIFFSVMAFKTRLWLEAVGYGLMVGGSLGNALDRIRIGAVVDFLDIHGWGWHWPTFNLADSFLFLGVALLLLASAKGRKPEPAR
ncbi:signal peptidase II [Lacibacterium aquatile]|uniref:Lipoprotein signal peptidase n=1 Tax=Lacibacterium aquatile TaxID=1168082 RepID=A0ABW5DUL4_9PROT